MAGIRNTPVSEVTVVLTAPVSTWVAVTVAPGSAAPLSSTTVPRISAWLVCAIAGRAASVATTRIAGTAKTGASEGLKPMRPSVLYVSPDYALHLGEGQGGGDRGSVTRIL